MRSNKFAGADHRFYIHKTSLCVVTLNAEIAHLTIQILSHNYTQIKVLMTYDVDLSDERHYCHLVSYKHHNAKPEKSLKIFFFYPQSNTQTHNITYLLDCRHF